MNRESQVKVLLLATLAGAGLLYGLTAADGYPWSASTHWALAWSGVLGELPQMAHPVWGYFVQMFDGHYIAMSVTFAALFAALVSALATKYFGWRVGLASALFATFAPPVWNAAATGSRTAFVLFEVAFGLVAVDLLLVRTLFAARKKGAANDVVVERLKEKRKNPERIIAWSLLGAAAVFMLASLTQHDYSLGEDATEYAEGVLKEATGKWVVMSGVADDQFYAAVRDGKLDVVLVSLRRDDINRRELLGRVRRTFPDELELVTAAEIGPREFVAAASKAHPDLFVLSDLVRTRQMVEKSGRADLLKRREPSVEALVAWNNEMVRAMDAGDMKKAGALAREILSRPKWRTFAPANAILGTLSGMEGDVDASERFFRTVFASGAEQPTVAYNDFAETLRRLGKLDEAEKFAREAVAKSGPKGWMARLTLIQVLDDAKKGEGEIRRLAAEAIRCAPEKVRPRFRDYMNRQKGDET